MTIDKCKELGDAIVAIYGLKTFTKAINKHIRIIDSLAKSSVHGFINKNGLHGNVIKNLTNKDDVAHLPLLERLPIRAERMRLNPTPAENEMRKILIDLEISFEHQFVVSPYIVDFFLKDYGLCLEVDGAVHGNPKQQKKDRCRTQYLEGKKFKYKVIRFSNSDVFSGKSKVQETIQKAIKNIDRQFIDRYNLQPKVRQNLMLKHKVKIPRILERRDGYIKYDIQ